MNIKTILDKDTSEFTFMEALVLAFVLAIFFTFVLFAPALLISFLMSELTYLVANATSDALFLYNKIRMPGRTNDRLSRTTFGTDGASRTQVHINEPAAELGA